MLTRRGQAGRTVFLSGSRAGYWYLVLLFGGMLGSMIVFALTITMDLQRRESTQRI